MKLSNQYQFYFNKEQNLIRKSINDFVKKEINPYIDEWEKNGGAPIKKIFKEMGKLGFLGIRYNSTYGGQGLDNWSDLVFLEEIGHIQSLGLQGAIVDHTHCATPAIHNVGSEFLKNKFLKPAILGEKVAAIAITEPSAGSDVASITTTAEKHSNHFIINGSKTFITNGINADFFVTLVKIEGASKYKSFSLIIIPNDVSGFSVGKKLNKLGWKSSDTAEIFFDSVKIPSNYLIGKEGEGFRYQMEQFQDERFSFIPLLYVSARDIINITIDYIRNRIVFGEPLIKKQVLRHRIAKWVGEIEMLKSMTYHIVKMKNHDINVTKEISICKLLGAKMLRKVVDGCLQMFGGMGYMEESIVCRYYRDARVLSILGGADEVMSEIIAKIELGK